MVDDSGNNYFANFAGHRLFAGVLSHMNFPRWFSGRFIAAHAAYEWLDAIVHGFDVLRQCLRGGEFVGAYVAGFLRIPARWSVLIGMSGSYMLSQLVELIERIRTRRAPITGQLTVHLKVTKYFYWNCGIISLIQLGWNLPDANLPAKIALNEQNGHFNRSMSILCSFHMCAVQSRHIFHSFVHSKHLNWRICSGSVWTWHFSCISRLSSVSNW